MRVLARALLIGLVFSPCPGTAAGGKQAVRLLERAGSAGEAVRLSDFFPADAPPELRARAQGIVFGSAPRLGTRRIIQDSQIKDALAADPFLLTHVSVPDRVAVSPVAWPIPEAAIRKCITDFFAVQGQTPPAGINSLAWPHEIMASTASPQLRVSDAAGDVQRRSYDFTLICFRPSRCAPFLVRLPEGPSGLKARVSYRRARNRWVARDPSAQVLVHPGDRCRLLLESGRIQVSMAVTCLERGGLGDIVRVRDLSRPRTFRAKITGEKQCSPL